MEVIFRNFFVCRRFSVKSDDVLTRVNDVVPHHHYFCVIQNLCFIKHFLIIKKCYSFKKHKISFCNFTFFLSVFINKKWTK